MLRPVALTTTLALAFISLAAIAQSPAPAPVPHNWPHIAALPPGTPILVHQPYQRYATPCALAWIDNTALACDTVDRYGSRQRVIFPASTIDSVRRDTSADPDHHSNAGLLFGMVIGGGIGTAIGARAGVGPAFVIGALGAGGGAAFAASVNNGIPGPPRPQFGVRFPLSARSSWRPVLR